MNHALLRELTLAVLLLVAVVSVVIGTAMLSPAAGWIAAGVLGAAWAVAVFGALGSAPRTVNRGPG